MIFKKGKDIVCCVFIFIILGVILSNFVDAVEGHNFTVTVTPANSSVVSGTTNVVVTIASLNSTSFYKNISEVFVKVRSFNGPILSIQRNVTTGNLTSYTISWPTGNGTFPDGLYTLLVDVTDANDTASLK